MKKFYEEDRIRDIADAIRRKSGKEDRMNVAEMSTAIRDMSSGGLPEEALNITGRLDACFANNHFAWYLNMYADRINATNIGRMDTAFKDSTKLIDLEQLRLNCDQTNDNRLLSIFNGCTNLKKMPKIINAKPTNGSYLFNNCTMLEEIPDDAIENWDFSTWRTTTTAAGYNFVDCHNLRYITPNLLSNMANNATTAANVYTNNAFARCYNLIELPDLPWATRSTSSISANLFAGCFSGLARLSKLTFQKNGAAPMVVKAKNSYIYLTTNAGHSKTTSEVKATWSGYEDNVCVSDTGTEYTTIEQVTAKYDRLKNTENWCAGSSKKVTYDGSSRYLSTLFSRYNHDSAVETLNSLPDTSATGTNYITFTSYNGALTDAGGINDLTEEEIAVAAAKGWTVGFEDEA